MSCDKNAGSRGLESLPIHSTTRWILIVLSPNVLAFDGIWVWKNICTLVAKGGNKVPKGQRDAEKRGEFGGARHAPYTFLAHASTHAYCNRDLAVAFEHRMKRTHKVYSQGLPLAHILNRCT